MTNAGGKQHAERKRVTIELGSTPNQVVPEPPPRAKRDTKGGRLKERGRGQGCEGLMHASTSIA